MISWFTDQTQAPALPSVPGYTLVREIGSGRNATVYEAQRNGSSLALKRLGEQEARRELNAMHRLRESKYVAQPLDTPVNANGAVYVPMPLFEVTLREVDLKSAVPATFARLILLPMAKLARDCARAGLVVTDLNPNNLMLRLSRDETLVQLVDVGSATNVGQVRASELEFTQTWAAPELEHQTIAPQTLSWSFGALARWAAGLYWHNPNVETEEVLAAAPWLGGPLAALISQCTASQPTNRPNPERLEREVARILKDSHRRCPDGHAILEGAQGCSCGETG